MAFFGKQQYSFVFIFYVVVVQVAILLKGQHLVLHQKGINSCYHVSVQMLCEYFVSICPCSITSQNSNDNINIVLSILLIFDTINHLTISYIPLHTDTFLTLAKIQKSRKYLKLLKGMF